MIWVLVKLYLLNAVLIALQSNQNIFCTYKVIYDVLTNIVFLIAWRNTALRNRIITIVTKIQWLAFSDNLNMLKVQCHNQHWTQCCCIQNTFSDVLYFLWRIKGTSPRWLQFNLNVQTFLWRVQKATLIVI